jgi:sugar phosphate isomerase/epimerase
VHPGETLADVRRAIGDCAVAVRQRLGCREPFGLGLRLSRRAVDELADPRALGALREAVAGHGCYAYTVNAFPYGAFHGLVVKESVYAPDWRDPARLDYTVAVARVLAELLPPGVQGSISTVPGSYRSWITRSEERAAIARAVAACAWELARIEERTGRHIALAIEPEPDCLIETTADSIRFFKEDLLVEGVRHLRAMAGEAAAENCVRRHVGICLDTCHVAMQFEAPAASLRELAGAGIRVAKIQISAALRAPLTADAIGRLPAFVDAVYLHQTRIRRGDGRIECHADLTPATIASLRPDPDARVRSHFHVPLHFSGQGDLRSSAGDLTPEFFHAAREVGCRHLEIETYTYDVLPAALRADMIVESVAREYEFVRARLASSASR